jgi:anti-anti-sigma factor
MIITRDEKEGKIIVRCEGRLDASSSPQLEGVLNDLMAQKKSKLLVDFNKIDYLSSAGMRLLLSMTKRMNTSQGKLLLFSIHEDVMEIIRMAGFEQILHIYSDEQKALSSS